MKVVNLETIIVTLWWYKTWQNSGSNLTHVSQKLQDTENSLQKFLEPERKPKVIYTDNSLEFGKACEDLSWNHCTSTPHRSETNGIAERAVRRIEEGTSAVLSQSGLDEKWYLRNIQDLLSDGITPNERRFGVPFDGPVIPCGAMVEYHPISAQNLSRLHQFGTKVLPGILLGRTRKSSRRIRRVFTNTFSRLIAGEARNDFWSISGNYILRHHVEPRVKLYVPREGSFPTSLRYIDVEQPVPPWM